MPDSNANAHLHIDKVIQQKRMEDQAFRGGADSTQVGGTHYKKEGGEQHWDRVHRLGLNWYAANVTKYVERYRDKNGVQDLEKARHYLDKLIEVERAREQSEMMKTNGHRDLRSAKHPYERIGDNG